MAELQNYFAELERKVKVAYVIAEQAREKGLDPVDVVEIPLATSLAERVIGLISIKYPQIKDPKIVKRIRELEESYSPLDPAVALKISEEIAKQSFCKFENLEEAMDAGIRVGLAYITLGVVSSPLEGFTFFKLKKTNDGEDYIAPYYSGPIRSAGGTAAAFSLLIIDYLREIMGFKKYDPTEKEVKRYVTELYDYHERITNLQYLPTEEEIEFLAKNLPIQISGEPSEDREVSNYKDLPRVETNFIRSGVCLVLGEGLAQKASKILRMIKKLREKGFELSAWDFLEDYVELHKKREVGKTDTSPTYIQDLVAGRPVLGHPSRSGAFRLRYGRSRYSGYSALSISPSTMAVLGGSIAAGTQLKIELPTKGCAVTSCDAIKGPIVKLIDGSVVRLSDQISAEQCYPKLKEIIYLGDILIPYGDFANRNHVLMPCGFNEEYWFSYIKKKDENAKREEMSDISMEKAIELSEKYKIPLHPDYIFFWTQIDKSNLFSLIDWLLSSKIEQNMLILPFSFNEEEQYAEAKRSLELLGVEHSVNSGKDVLINKEMTWALLLNLGIVNVKDFEKSKEKLISIKKEKDTRDNVLSIINSLCPYEIKDLAGTFIGARMGRPEKAKLRKLTGSPHALFPVGEEGGRFRSVQEAIGKKVYSDFPVYHCDKCDADTIYFICEICGSKTQQKFYCNSCKKFVEEDSLHGKNKEHEIKKYLNYGINIGHYLDSATKNLNFHKENIPQLIKGIRGTSSEDHVPENLAKGILRAMFGLHVNKDGTIRYDATELPVTHFKPKEIRTSIEKLKKLGYNQDIYGKIISSGEQIIELRPHDIILPDSDKSPDEKAGDVLLNIANFIDNLLVRFYGSRPFFELKSKEDLVGHLILCIAPHNCAGVVGRIIGFSQLQALLASPYMHAAMRRDCLGYDNYVSIEKDGLWQIKKIGNWIESLNPSEKADNFGTLKRNIKDIFTWSNPGRKEIIEVTKHQPAEMLKIYLEDGRKIELTKNHKVYLKGYKEKRTSELNIGDKLIVNYKKNIQERDIQELFLPEIFKGREDVMLRNIRDYLTKFEDLNKHESFYQRDSFPITFVESFLKKYNQKLSDLPDRTSIAIKRDNVCIPIKINLDEKLLEVIGLYIAEGFLRKNISKKGFYQISIAGNNEIKELVKQVFFSHFGLEPSEDHMDHVTFSSRIIYELFKDYFKTGHNAGTKRIPSMFLNLKREKIAALLRGYFEGDGSVSISDKRVVCDTTSEGLQQDISFTLSRFNIFTKFYEYEKEPGPKVKEFYIKKRKPIPKFRITKVTIPSNFVERFSKINFISKRKKDIFNEISKKSHNGMKIDFDDDYVYPKIIKIEEVSEKSSYCFNIVSEHNFFSNDVLVHNCDGDEAAFTLLMDCLLNFSKKYLPSHRGGTQDAPLVLNARIRANEVDDMVFDLDVSSELPLELYQAAEKHLLPSKIKMEQISQRIGTDHEFTEIGFTHDTSNIDNSVLCSSYKTLATMQEKVLSQLEIAEKIRAVDESDVANLVVSRHFIRDIKGNLRQFTTQQFRCVNCNEKYRRPPLRGHCLKCGGKIIFTVSEGTIIKYLEPALQLAKKYDIPSYVKQSLELVKNYTESIFGAETEKQKSIKNWF